MYPSPRYASFHLRSLLCGRHTSFYWIPPLKTHRRGLSWWIFQLLLTICYDQDDREEPRLDSSSSELRNRRVEGCLVSSRGRLIAFLLSIWESPSYKSYYIINNKNDFAAMDSRCEEYDMARARKTKYRSRRSWRQYNASAHSAEENISTTRDLNIFSELAATDMHVLLSTNRFIP